MSCYVFAGLYYGVSICLVSFASAMAVVTLNIHHRGVRGNAVPDIIKQIVLGFLAKVFFLHFDASKHLGGHGHRGANASTTSANSPFSIQREDDSSLGFRQQLYVSNFALAGTKNGEIFLSFRRHLRSGRKEFAIVVQSAESLSPSLSVSPE